MNIDNRLKLFLSHRYKYSIASEYTWNYRWMSFWRKRTGNSNSGSQSIDNFFNNLKNKLTNSVNDAINTIDEQGNILLIAEPFDRWCQLESLRACNLDYKDGSIVLSEASRLKLSSMKINGTWICADLCRSCRSKKRIRMTLYCKKGFFFCIYT